jgi:glycosyltransferase involved in cell wall biosynthesis
LRILMVNSSADITAGGTEKHVFELGGELQRRGHEISYLHAFPNTHGTYEPNTTVLHPTDWREDDVRRLRNHLDDLVSRPSVRLGEIVAAYEPDLVHTHQLVGITTGIWEVCRTLGLPVVHTLHDYQLLCPRKSLRRHDGEPCRPSPLLCGVRTRRMTRWAPAVSHVVGVSNFIIDAHRDIFEYAEHSLIRHPIVAPAMRHLRPPGDRLRRIGYIGQMHVIKGIRPLIAAIPDLHARGVAVAMAGLGRQAQEAAEAAERLAGLEYFGLVTGARKEEFFESCDAGIVPSVWDEPGGPAYASVEWLCSGRPLLTSSRGGLGESLELVPGGIVIEPTRDGIVTAVNRLLDPGAWADALANVRPVTEACDYKRWTSAHESVYERTLQRRPSKHSLGRG